MKLVHEVYGKFQVGGGNFRPFALSLEQTERGELPRGGYLDICAEADNVNYEQPWQPADEAIHFEGDMYSMLRLFRELVQQIEANVTLHIAHGLLDPEWESKQTEPTKRRLDIER